ncbi:hypothetical protein BESB_079970 [Besnoitia besnoiti]|uniref:Uncharacterized protein n=1 Tax=Besnoitia besnoiti TaxID=94643 RepID=A0A2A9MBT8_BESBE|nr:hypothetical protein BESB_079970 [Besnoitia besnoiti]PFH33781.1 hypothetical protein BESB_079970 [Besnoitia besnoiti]
MASQPWLSESCFPAFFVRADSLPLFSRCFAEDRDGSNQQLPETPLIRLSVAELLKDSRESLLCDVGVFTGAFNALLGPCGHAPVFVRRAAEAVESEPATLAARLQVPCCETGHEGRRWTGSSGVDGHPRETPVKGQFTQWSRFRFQTPAMLRRRPGRPWSETGVKVSMPAPVRRRRGVALVFRADACIPSSGNSGDAAARRTATAAGEKVMKENAAKALKAFRAVHSEIDRGEKLRSLLGIQKYTEEAKLKQIVTMEPNEDHTEQLTCELKILRYYAHTDRNRTARPRDARLHRQPHCADRHGAHHHPQRCSRGVSSLEISAREYVGHSASEAVKMKRNTPLFATLCGFNFFTATAFFVEMILRVRCGSAAHFKDFVIISDFANAWFGVANLVVVSVSFLQRLDNEVLNSAVALLWATGPRRTDLLPVSSQGRGPPSVGADGPTADERSEATGKRCKAGDMMRKEREGKGEWGAAEKPDTVILEAFSGTEGRLEDEASHFSTFTDFRANEQCFTSAMATARLLRRAAATCCLRAERGVSGLTRLSSRGLSADLCASVVREEHGEYGEEEDDGDPGPDGQLRHEDIGGGGFTQAIGDREEGQAATELVPLPQTTPESRSQFPGSFPLPREETPRRRRKAATSRAWGTGAGKTSHRGPRILCPLRLSTSGEGRGAAADGHLDSPEEADVLLGDRLSTWRVTRAAAKGQFQCTRWAVEFAASEPLGVPTLSEAASKDFLGRNSLDKSDYGWETASGGNEVAGIWRATRMRRRLSRRGLDSLSGVTENRPHLVPNTLDKAFIDSVPDSPFLDMTRSHPPQILGDTHVQVAMRVIS